jgi:katanin p80 WD40 repeat-containing subunit B1
LAGHQSGVECVAFDAAEEAVVAGAAGGTLKMFDIAAAKGARARTPRLRCGVPAKGR